VTPIQEQLLSTDSVVLSVSGDSVVGTSVEMDPWAESVVDWPSSVLDSTVEVSNTEEVLVSSSSPVVPVVASDVVSPAVVVPPTSSVVDSLSIPAMVLVSSEDSDPVSPSDGSRVDVIVLAVDDSTAGASDPDSSAELDSSVEGLVVDSVDVGIPVMSIAPGNAPSPSPDPDPSVVRPSRDSVVGTNPDSVTLSVVGVTSDSSSPEPDPSSGTGFNTVTDSSTKADPCSVDGPLVEDNSGLSVTGVDSVPVS